MKKEISEINRESDLQIRTEKDIKQQLSKIEKDIAQKPKRK
jgi:hypothetical protein